MAAGKDVVAGGRVDKGGNDVAVAGVGEDGDEADGVEE